MLVVVEREDVHGFGEVVEHYVDMPGYETAFGNLQLVFLLEEFYVVAPACEFIAQVSESACRNGNLFVTRKRNFGILCRNIEEGIKYVGILFSSERITAVRFRGIERLSLAVNDECHAVFILHDLECFLRHKD